MADERRDLKIVGLGLIGTAGLMWLFGSSKPGPAPGPKPGPAPTPPPSLYNVFDRGDNLLLTTGDKQAAINRANAAGCGAYVRYEAGTDRPIVAYRAPCPQPPVIVQQPPPPSRQVPPPIPVAATKQVYYDVRNLNGSVRLHTLDRQAAINLANSLGVAGITVWQEGPTDGGFFGNIVALAQSIVIYQTQGQIAGRSGFGPTTQVPVAPGVYFDANGQRIPASAPQVGYAKAASIVASSTVAAAQAIAAATAGTIASRRTYIPPPPPAPDDRQAAIAQARAAAAAAAPVRQRMGGLQI